MADILTTWDPLLLQGDWVLEPPDLAGGADLESAVILSLFTDRLALPDDPLPDPSDGDRRGWWADWNADEVFDQPVGLIGSRIWLLEREKATNDVRLRAEDYTREALQWLLDDDVADEVNVAAEWAGVAPGRLDVAVEIIRNGRVLLARSYSWAWAQRGVA